MKGFRNRAFGLQKGKHTVSKKGKGKQVNNNGERGNRKKIQVK